MPCTVFLCTLVNQLSISQTLYSLFIYLFHGKSIHSALIMFLFKVTNKCWPWISNVTRTLFPGETISAGEIQRTEPAGIWHLSDISVLPSPFFVHTPTCKQYDGFTQKLGYFFLTMGDWEAHNLLWGTGCTIQDLRISCFLDPTPCFPPPCTVKVNYYA